MLIGGIILLVLIVILVRTLMFKGTRAGSGSDPIKVNYEETAGAQKLAEAVRIKTISYTDSSKNDKDAFREYHQLMEKMFPLVHERLEREVINQYSLLYRWKGTHSVRKPIMITAHMDVVPVEKGTEKDWTYEPFSGAIEGGYVWGRGTLDTKIHMIAALEAVELLLKEGYAPERDVYLAFGHDEEVGGTDGASHIVRYLQDKGIQIEYLIDEGGCITEGVMSDIPKPLALIGIGEKGFANIKITVAGGGGHSSMPPKHSALGMAAKVIGNLENKQFPLKLIKPVEEFLMKIGPRMKFANRLILANLWLFKPLFVRIFAKNRSGNAMLRTTTAATMAQASEAPNVLPQKASTVINFRILPGETGEDLLRHINKVNKGIPMDIEVLRLEEPSKVSSSKTEGFSKIENIARQVYGDILVAPYIVMAGTDARKYEAVCENIYRFTPYRLKSSEMSKIHGTNENISIENVNRCIEFFYILLKPER